MYSYQKVSSQEDRNDIKLFGEFAPSHDRPAAFCGDMGIMGFGRGFTLRHRDKAIGGIGVSGLSEEEDERISYVANRNVYG